MKQMVEGKKTYVMAALLAVYAISGAILGKMDWNNAIQLILGSGIGAALRAGIAKGK